MKAIYLKKKFSLHGSPEFWSERFTVIVSILALLTFVIQYTFRTLDDNRLTSWQWVFLYVKGWKIYLIIVASTILSYISSTYIIPSLKDSRFDNKLLILSVLSFIVIIPFWQEPEIIVDASRYFTQAKHLEVYGIGYFLKEWGKEMMAWTDLPLIPFVYGLIFKVMGEERLYIQLFNTVIFSLTVILTYLTGRTLWNEDTGFYGGLLLMGIPYVFTQVPLMLVDIHVMFLLILTTYTFIRAITHAGIWIPIASLSIFFAFFSKYSIWLMISVLFVISSVYLLQGYRLTQSLDPKGCNNGILTMPIRGSIIRRVSLTSLLSASLIGLLLVYKSDIFFSQLNLLFEYQRPGLKRWTEGFASTFLFQVHPFITALALYSSYIAFKKRDTRYLIIGYLILLVVLFQIKRIRYTIPVFPMLTLMASYAMQGWASRPKRFVGLCIITSSLSISLFAYLPFIEGMSAVNLKMAGHLLNTMNIDTVEVVTVTPYGSPVNQAVSVPILDIFTRKEIRYHYKSDTLPLNKDIEVSPLRFTWEYKNPSYYMTDLPADALVVISEEDEEMFPDYLKEKTRGYCNRTVFNISDGIFQYRTFVTIYTDFSTLFSKERYMYQ